MIIFSDHAKLKLKQRHLTTSMVRLTIEQPNRTENAYDHRKMMIRNFGKLDLRVILVEENGDTIVVTAYWHEKEKMT